MKAPTSPPATRIRPPTAEDAPEFLGLVRASRRFHGRWASPPSTAAGFLAYLERGRDPSLRLHLLCRATDGAIVGAATLSQIFLHNFRSAYLGYWVGEPYAGRGYMTAGLRLVLRDAFTRVGLHRIEANIQPENAPSLALVARVGFRKEGFSPRYLKVAGRWRDHERWALLKEDWRQALRRR